MTSRNNFSKNKPTIKDVARLCGVSTQTISRVLNQRPDVSPNTRERVLEVIDQIGYQPSALARSLIQQRSFTLGIIIAGLKYAGISLTLNGIAEQADKEGYSLLLKELPSFDISDVQPVIRSLMSHQVEAIIYAAPECGDNWINAHTQCPQPSPPMVFLKGSPYPGMATISIDNYSGAYLATSHLLEQGCRRIAHISGPIEWWETNERIKGWRTALTDAGIDADMQCFVQGNWSSASGEKAFLEILETDPSIEGVFAANDQMALAAIYIAHQRGIKIPQQLAISGFDDLPETPYYTPALTTVRQDLRTLGIMAVKKCMQMVNPDDYAGDDLPDTIVLKPQLIVRQSSLYGKTP